jgi:parvulin-like peptidyl-prolyl isomerase
MGMSIMSIRRVAKRLLAPVIIVLVVAMMVGVFYIGFPAMNRPVDSSVYVGPSIKVNGQLLKDDEFNNYMMQAGQQAQQYAQYGMSYSEAQIRDTAVSMAIKDIAFQQEMKKAASKIKVTHGDVDALIKKYLPTEEEVQSFMERQGYTSKNQLKDMVFKQLEQQKFVLLKAHQLKISVSQAEILASLQQITVSHILIGLKDANNKPRTDGAALQLANQVYQKVTSGGDFAQLAKQYSEDPGSKDKGGTYGPMPLDQFKTSMDKVFVAGALALKNGQISKPIKTQFGYHIIRLDALSTPDAKSSEYKEKYTEIRDNLLLKKVQESPLFTAWADKITRDAQSKLEILDPGLRAFRLQQEQKWPEAAQAYQKALEKNYYKSQINTYLDASTVYLQLKQPKEALAILKKAPVASTDSIDYQAALANAYKANNETAKGQEILVKYGQAHAGDVKVHTQLKAIYTQWNLTDLAAKENQFILDAQKKEQEGLQKYQESLKQKAPAAQQQVQQPAAAQTTPPTTTSKK